MEWKPRLIGVELPDRPDAAVLVLHGGASRPENMEVGPTQLSVLRMVPIARRVARVGRGRLAVFRLLNSTRGWNASHTPVRDAVWGLEQVADRYGARLPACVIGHSLGGRAALLTAGRPEVRSAVALAPWVYATDLADGLAGKRILIVHGAKDRIASPARSAALARALSREGAEVSYVSVADGKHAMLGRHAIFAGLAADFAAATLLDTPGTGPIARVMAGEAWISL